MEIKNKISELLCSSHQGDDYQEEFGDKCPICTLEEALVAAELRIKELQTALTWFKDD